MDARSRRLVRIENRINVKALRAHEEGTRRRSVHLDRVLRRFAAALERATPLFSEADRLRLNPPGEDLPKDWVLRPWFESLARGRSKLPNLNVQTTRALLEAWLHPKVYCYSMVCLDCGLCRPELDPVALVGPPPCYDAPNFFACCPHCQSTRHNWTHLNEPTWEEVSG